MDKKNQLNPKFKEIYDRVMNTKLQPAAQVLKPMPSTPKEEKHPLVLEGISLNASKPLAIKKPVKPISNMLLLITSGVFFLAYAFFWIRFFNLKLPFNLPF